MDNPFPHIDISPDQRVLTNRHPTHNTDGNGFGINPTLFANNISQPFLILHGISVKRFYYLAPARTLSVGSKMDTFPHLKPFTTGCKPVYLKS